MSNFGSPGLIISYPRNSLIKPITRNNHTIYPDQITQFFTFIDALKRKNIEFFSEDFLYFKDYDFTVEDFVYYDPPYLISNASYNDGKRGFKNWTEKEEVELLSFLDVLNEKDVKFLLSNVLVYKGLENSKLIEWSEKYNIKYIDKNYKNCSYRLKEKNKETKEVVIFNYK